MYTPCSSLSIYQNLVYDLQVIAATLVLCLTETGLKQRVNSALTLIIHRLILINSILQIIQILGGRAEVYLRQQLNHGIAPRQRLSHLHKVNVPSRVTTKDTATPMPQLTAHNQTKQILINILVNLLGYINVENSWHAPAHATDLFQELERLLTHIKHNVLDANDNMLELEIVGCELANELGDMRGLAIAGPF